MPADAAASGRCGGGRRERGPRATRSDRHLLAGASSSTAKGAFHADPFGIPYTAPREKRGGFATGPDDEFLGLSVRVFAMSRICRG